MPAASGSTCSTGPRRPVSTFASSCWPQATTWVTSRPSGGTRSSRSPTASSTSSSAAVPAAASVPAPCCGWMGWACGRCATGGSSRPSSWPCPASIQPAGRTVRPAMRTPASVVSTGMTTITQGTPPSHLAREQAAAASRVRRRLRPLYVSAWILGVNFWVPVEKLFLSHIGFTAASIGLLAATYAAVVPFLEIPSGILADRWSRRGVLMLANVALGGSAIAGGLSTNVHTYLLSALLLGGYF